MEHCWLMATFDELREQAELGIRGRAGLLLRMTSTWLNRWQICSLLFSSGRRLRIEQMTTSEMLSRPAAEQC